MSRYWLSWVAGCLGALLVTVTFSARAEPTYATFSIPDVWPWAYEAESGEQRGSLIRLANRLSDISGIPIRAELRPLRRVIREITAGDVGFTFLFQSPELDEKAVPVHKVMNVNLLLLAAADTDYPLDLQSLADQRVAYIRGTYLGEAFKNNADIVKVPVNSVGQAMELLMMGRVAAILASDHNILRTIESRDVTFRQFRYQRHVQGQPAMLYRSRSGRSRSGSEDHADKFTRALEAMAESGELQSIFFGQAE
ncbi:transporter substrate-binding domain-containing protein [Marinobacter sp. M-5]|uniref:substrate-binding periplasmic protein n=1 Tax=Marinobacter sp. M-5 TaxID=3081089 RepID=UPI00293C2E11|nr:transporter substrate-binding domain-containing protein [Marinobacter sp. M-5]MDV3503134.1 transporter substrate-binding domain-containing protein [Marinobacter sp. M-5]